MNKNILKGLFVLLVFGMMSCDDFGDINVNPNEPTFVDTETLLTSSEKAVGDVVGSYFGELYAQHMSQITYTEDSRYGATKADWSYWYRAPLADLQKIINLNSDEATKGSVLGSGSNANQVGVARILKAYFFNHIVERWGPSPYSKALQGGSDLLPAYDGEQAIYSDLLKELTEAAAQLDGGSVSGDIIFGGDTEKWKLFANTLRAQIALKISDADEGLAKSNFVSAYEGGFIAASYDYLGEQANENPWFSRFRTRTDYAVSSTLVDYMTATSDPRLASYADPAADTETIVGMPYGLENSEYAPTSVSFPNSTYVKAQDRDIPIISAAQIEFMKAEAIERGFITGDAAEFFNAGVMASMAQWGIDDADAIASYMSGDGVAYDAGNWKKSIGMQLWVSLYGQGYDAWREWRRLDYPVLESAQSPLNPAEGVPVRNMYPPSESTLNSANLEAGIGLLGGTDSDGVKLWWDKN